MARISSIDRNQTFLFCLDNYISDDNPVRIIDSGIWQLIKYKIDISIESA